MNSNIRYNDRYLIPKSLGAWNKIPRTMLIIFIDRQCRTNSISIMVVEIWVCTRWSMQSSNNDLEHHEKLPCTERIINNNQDNAPNGQFCHQKAVRKWYYHAHNTWIILLCHSSQMSNTQILPLRQQPHPRKTEWHIINATMYKK